MKHLKRSGLIVDDEETIRYVLSAQLAKLGYRSVTVASGQEALEKMTHREFDLVLLDVRMPGMSGLEVLDRIRSKDARTCVAMLSAVIDAAVAAHAQKLGADDYIAKPCDLGYLKKRLDLALERRARPGKSEARGLPTENTGKPDTDSADAMADLIAQQVAQFEQLTSGGLDK